MIEALVGKMSNFPIDALKIVYPSGYIGYSYTVTPGVNPSDQSSILVCKFSPGQSFVALGGGDFPIGLNGSVGTLKLDITLSAAPASNTMLASLENSDATSRVRVFLDSSNRPSLEFVVSGVTVGSWTPSGLAQDSGVRLQLVVVWDAANPITGSDHITFLDSLGNPVNGSWGTAPTSSWSPQPLTRMLVGWATSYLDFAGTIGSVQISESSLVDLVPLTAPVDSSISPSISVTRSTGTAPFSVSFDATGTTATGETYPRRSCLFSWDFDDVSAGTWAVSGRSKNSSYGFSAGHVFETPGTYNVTLTVMKENGSYNTATQVITVNDPDVVYSGTNTICVSTSGTFTGAPSGCVQLTTSDASHSTLLTAMSLGRRILFRRGETFTMGSAWGPDTTANVHIGAFGTGAKPIINYTDTYTYSCLCQSAGGVIRDLDVRTVVSDIRAFWSYQVANVLFLRLEFTGFSGGIASASAASDVGTAFVDNTIHNMTGGAGNVGIWFPTSNGLCMGNSVPDATGGEHCFRSPLIRKGVIAHNYFGKAYNTKLPLKLHAYPDPPASTTHDVVISDNFFEPGTGNPWAMECAPQNSGVDERLEDLLVERNFIRYVESNASTVGIIMTGTRNTVRHNILDMSGNATDRSTGINVGKLGLEPDPSDVAVYGNTVYSSQTDYALWGTYINSGVTSSLVRNNLVVVPSGNSSSFEVVVSGGASGITNDHNLLTVPTVFVNTSPANKGDYAIVGSATLVLDQGAATGCRDIDFDGVSRPVGSAYDIGAYERTP